MTPAEARIAAANRLDEARNRAAVSGAWLACLPAAAERVAAAVAGVTGGATS